jgi:hypothetical protein
VLANDYDPDGEGIRLTGTFIQPQHGSVVVDSYTAAIYTPSPCFAGTDTFQYDVQDDRGAVSRATVTVTVSNNHMPVAINDSVTVSGGYGIINVTGNDCDPDGESPSLDPNNYLIQQPAHGTVKIYGDMTNRSLVYYPSNGYIGPDSIVYIIRDAAGHYSNQATISISVQR